MSADLSSVGPLPPELMDSYRAWQGRTYDPNAPEYRRLVDDGQSPKAMVISCCDSRVLPTEIFGADVGDAFVHRNIANFVPPNAPDGDSHGTAAAIEYGVTALKVSHLVVMGHAACGGVMGCRKMCAGEAPELEAKGSFVGRWLDMIRPAYAATNHAQDDAAAQTEMEQQAVLLSIRNLLSFPFVATAVNNGSLSLHAVWNDIGAGALWVYDPAAGAFKKV